MNYIDDLTDKLKNEGYAVLAAHTREELKNNQKQEMIK